jgi:hypothetical protein
MLWREINSALTHTVVGSMSDRLQNDKEAVKRTA